MYNLNEPIDAFYVHANPYGSSAGDLKVYIPSLMPEIIMGYPLKTPVSLNKSCYANANDCMPTIAANLDTQNYVTAKAAYNSYTYPCYRFGRFLKVIPKTPDCLTCKLFPEEGDNSTYWPD